jgi:hypothetical protein
LKKFLKFEFTHWAIRGEASGRLEVWLLFTIFLVARLAPWIIGIGVGLRYLQDTPSLWA